MTYGAEYWGPALASAATSWLSNEQNSFNSQRQMRLGARLSLQQAEKMPSAQVAGLRAAGINPLLTMGASPPQVSALPVAPVDYGRDLGQMMQAANSVGVGSAQQALTEQQTSTERMRTAVTNNEAIRGNYEVMQLAGTLDAAMKETGELGASAISALEQPRIRAGLAELRAALASAKNIADVEEAINSKGVSLALDVLGKVTGSGGSIAAAVDRFRARSQRGSIIDLNKE